MNGSFPDTFSPTRASSSRVRDPCTRLPIPYSALRPRYAKTDSTDYRKTPLDARVIAERTRSRALVRASRRTDVEDSVRGFAPTSRNGVKGLRELEDAREVETGENVETTGYSRIEDFDIEERAG